MKSFLSQNNFPGWDTQNNNHHFIKLKAVLNYWNDTVAKMVREHRNAEG